MIPRTLPLLLAIACVPVQAASPERGRLLYGNYCYHCHLTEIHFRVNSKIDSPEALRQTVRIWQGEMGLGWKEEDVRDVASYLNARYYQLPEAPAAAD